MLRRILISLAALLLIGIVAFVIVVRVVVFGGTPAIHHTNSPPLLVGSPCTTLSPSAGLRAFRINSQQSSALYDAQFQVAGQTVPGMVSGETGDVSGELLLTSDTNPTITSMRIVVDLRTLDSGAPERDDHVRNDTLETSKYPYAIFTVTDAQVLPGSYSEGQTVHFKLKGQLTLHGVTRSVTFNMQAELLGNVASGTGSTLIHLQDYNMRTPMLTTTAPVTVSKDVTLMMQFVAQKENCTQLT